MNWISQTWFSSLSQFLCKSSLVGTDYLSPQNSSSGSLSTNLGLSTCKYMNILEKRFLCSLLCNPNRLSDALDAFGAALIPAIQGNTIPSYPLGPCNLDPTLPLYLYRKLKLQVLDFKAWQGRRGFVQITEWKQDHFPNQPSYFFALSKPPASAEYKVWFLPILLFQLGH